MRERTKRLLPLFLALLLVVSIILPANAAPSGTKIITTPTGYTKAEDVDYLEVTGQFYDPVAKKNVTKTIVANWGARGEDALFLTSYATAFYTGSNTYASFAQLDGSNQQNQVPSSPLFQALQDFMESKHTYYTHYNGSSTEKKNVRAFYMYTDCISNDTSQVSILYRGGMVTSEWNQGNIWNQEHCWPQNKLNKSNEGEVGDIMHLRPANPSENSSRSNKCYGENSGSNYYDPGISVRGDCARMMLYMYVRWNKTSTMWGSSGVMESIDILLKWMEEDPVDTWEMARNDSVQSITGTRNVFVDYPELAFLLFDEEIPASMTTPSGQANAGTSNTNPPPTTESTPPATESTPPATESAPPATESTPPATESTPPATESTPPTTESTPPATESTPPTTESAPPDGDCTHTNTKIVNQKDASCKEEGYSGDTVCSDCGEPIIDGTILPITGSHNFGQWVTEKEATAKETGLQIRICNDCGHKESQELPVLEESYTWVIITVVCVAAVCTGGAVYIILRRRK